MENKCGRNVQKDEKRRAKGEKTKAGNFVIIFIVVIVLDTTDKGL
jgi:hypothetical protein